MIKHYEWKTIRANTLEEELKAYNDACFEEFMNAHEHIDEIKAVFEKELAKSNDGTRNRAAEEIIKYLYAISYSEYLATGDKSNLAFHSGYADSLIYIANMVEAAGKGDVETFEKVLNALPWGDSGTGDQIAYNSTMFAIWILSDESREKVYDIVFNRMKNSNNALGSAQKTVNIMCKFFNMSTLESLIEHNNESEEMVNAKIKAAKKQPGNGDGSEE